MIYFKYKQDHNVQVNGDGRKVLYVDIQPEKACIFNCIVCTHGQTKYQGEWHDFGPHEESLADLRAKIAEVKPDIVEIYGQGDILTNVHLEEIIDCIHGEGKPVRLITNCYLLGIGEHMRVVCKCEEVVGAFGIVDEEAFKKYHRPLPELNFSAEKQTESLVNFCNNYKGKFKLRVFFSKGFNDRDETVAKIKGILERLTFDSLWVISTSKLTVDDGRIAEIASELHADE